MYIAVQNSETNEWLISVISLSLAERIINSLLTNMKLFPGTDQKIMIMIHEVYILIQKLALYITHVLGKDWGVFVDSLFSVLLH